MLAGGRPGRKGERGQQAQGSGTKGWERDSEESANQQVCMCSARQGHMDKAFIVQVGTWKQHTKTWEEATAMKFKDKGAQLKSELLIQSEGMGQRACPGTGQMKTPDPGENTMQEAACESSTKEASSLCHTAQHRVQRS